MQHKQIETIECAIDALLEDYLNRHSKALVVRFDVHYPENYPMVSGNEDISACMAYVVKSINVRVLILPISGSGNNTAVSILITIAPCFSTGKKVRGYRHVFQNVEGLGAAHSQVFHIRLHQLLPQR